MIDAVLARLTSLHPKVIDLSLDRIDRLLEALGRPERRLPPVVHVAGTNGKGSTVAMLRAFFEAAGMRAHVYTSPHLVRFAERIRIGSQLWDDGALLALLEEVEAANNGEPITFFEITTAAAFLAFSREPADICLLETGLGGRLDATNMVERPALTILTPIAMDHQQFLGGHIEAIAAEKVAIMKHGVPCVVADQVRKVNKVVEARSLQYGVPLMKEGEDFFVRALPGNMMLYKGKSVEMTLPAPSLPGTFQIRNAGVALAAMERLARLGAPSLFPDFPGSALARGMTGIEWPARMQHLTRGPLVDLLPEGWELWLDGGHNPHAAEAIARHCRGWRDKPLYGVFGILANKDASGYLKHLGSRFKALRTIAIPGEPSTLSAEDAAAKAAAAFIIDAAPAASVEAGIRDLVAGQKGPGRILICGSLYLAGSVLRDNG
jgi:dihydrofolate synthase / folylpolyglutamate synthase